MAPTRPVTSVRVGGSVSRERGTPARGERELRGPGPQEQRRVPPAAALCPPAALTCSAQLRARTEPLRPVSLAELPHARRAAARPGTLCRAGFHRRPQPPLPARPLPGDSVKRPPSLRTRPDSLHQGVAPTQSKRLHSGHSFGNLARHMSVCWGLTAGVPPPPECFHHRAHVICPTNSGSAADSMRSVEPNTVLELTTLRSTPKLRSIIT
ncbi:uncharacterized protein LOC117796473 [Ailuropoda melanoleuca]|uniref:uncharacterized protein LOC117796473 n=1 Tax=Ailuropoda melanoleuca TaxID=9646 RepID=UPI00149401F7|nr:uncharacterized protein LOC117796473 [Ailuropoda melanoleuca]